MVFFIGLIFIIIMALCIWLAIRYDLLDSCRDIVDSCLDAVTGFFGGLVEFYKQHTVALTRLDRMGEERKVPDL